MLELPFGHHALALIATVTHLLPAIRRRTLRIYRLQQDSIDHGPLTRSRRGDPT
jgi:hypothetical protein